MPWVYIINKGNSIFRLTPWIRFLITNFSKKSQSCQKYLDHIIHNLWNKKTAIMIQNKRVTCFKFITSDCPLRCTSLSHSVVELLHQYTITFTSFESQSFLMSHLMPFLVNVRGALWNKQLKFEAKLNHYTLIMWK